MLPDARRPGDLVRFDPHLGWNSFCRMYADPRHLDDVIPYAKFTCGVVLARHDPREEFYLVLDSASLRAGWVYDVWIKPL